MAIGNPQNMPVSKVTEPRIRGTKTISSENKIEIQAIVDAFQCPAFLIRSSTHEILASNKFAAQKGVLPGELCYRTWANSDTPCSFCLASSVSKEGKAQHCETKLGSAFLGIYWVHMAEDLVLVFSFDLTERKNIEDALKESEKKYRSLFNSMSNGFAYCQVVYDKKGDPEDFIYLEINDAFEKIAGLSKANIVGKRASEVNADLRKACPNFFQVFKRVAATGKTERFEVFIDQLNIWLSVTAYSLEKGYGAALLENITEQKLARQKLEEHSKSLEMTIASRTEELTETHRRLIKAERFAAIGELAGMVGHDLRNPLTSIKNAAYYLNRKRGTQMDPKEKAMFEVIDKSVDHANKIIANLLDYSKEITLEIEECTPKSLIDYVLLMTQFPAGIKVHDQTEDQPTMWVDSNKMERVFINLIKNAVDAMRDGGRLDISSKQVGENVEFTFADTGTGMTEQTKAKLFMPLFTTKAQGMGFGLAICKRIIDAHGGRILVESTLGTGTKFTIVLPIEQEFNVQCDEQIAAADQPQV